MPQLAIPLHHQVLSSGTIIVVFYTRWMLNTGKFRCGFAPSRYESVVTILLCMFFAAFCQYLSETQH
jgi:hypothetical protein